MKPTLQVRAPIQAGIKLLLVFLLLGIAGWMLFSRPVAPPIMPMAPFVIVELGDVLQTVQAAAVVQPKLKVDVGAQVTGQIRTVLVQLGQSVKKGDELISIDPKQANNDLKQSEAAVLQQELTLESRRVDLVQAQAEAQRQQRLLKGSATSVVDADKAKTDAAKLELDVRSQASLVGKLRADLENTRLKLGYTQITAPMDGDVVSIVVQEGQAVNAQNQSPTLLTLAVLDTMTIRAQVSEADVKLVHLGQQATFTSLGDSQRTHVGEVRLVQPIPEKVNGAVFFNVLFDVSNVRADAKAIRTLLSDMSGQARLNVAQAVQVPLIPLSALGAKSPDGRYMVYLPGSADAEPIQRLIKLGLSDSNQAEVVEGLRVGDRVFLTPPRQQFNLTLAKPPGPMGIRSPMGPPQ